MAKMYDASQREGESLDHYYKRLAKVADQRLVRLEELSKQDGFSAVLGYSYKRALKDIHQWSGEEANRFNMKPPSSQVQLLAKINDIKEFLSKPSSTKGQIVSFYKKRADTLNKKFGTSFTWQSLATYYDSGLADKLDDYGYQTAFKMIGRIQKKTADEIQAIKDANIKHVITKEDDMIDVLVSKALHDSGLNFDNFIRS